MINTVRTSCEPVKKNIKPNIILLMTLLLIGVLIGTLAFCNMSQDDFNNFSFITQMFIKKKSEQTFLQSLINSFSTSASLLLICFFLGFSAISQPVEITIPIFRGLGLGASIAYIYVTYGIKGFLISLLLIIPNAVISSISIIMAKKKNFIGKFRAYIMWKMQQLLLHFCIN